MSSVREQILADIAARLDTIPLVTVQRSRLVPVKRSDVPYIVVTPIDEEATALLAERYERVLTVRVSVFARGAVPEQVADAVAVQVYAKLQGTLAARRLGGLATHVHELSRAFEMAEADLDAIEYQMQFAVTYRTKLASEETAA